MIIKMSFKGKTAIVTGAAGGMGSQIALDLISAGATVARIDRKPQRSSVSAALDFHGDLRDESFVRDVTTKTFASTGRLDYLVNAAGVLWFGRDCSVVEIDLDLWDEIMSINLKSMVHTARHAIGFMRESGGGAMVHVSTTQCLRGDDRPQDAYQASKAGVLALSKSLAIQFAPDGIRSNVLLPGSTESPMQARWVDNPSLKDATAAGIPLGRVGTAADMSNATLFLLSDAAAYITGTELVVDGGYLAKP